MNSLTQALKAEIARVARKELKDELLALRRTVAAHRSEIAALKRQLKDVGAQLKAGQRQKRAEAADAGPADAAPARGPRGGFRAEALAAERARLGFTQAQMARLVGVSPLSIYKWESGKVKPRAAQLALIAGVRGMGKREARARLAA